MTFKESKRLFIGIPIPNELQNDLSDFVNYLKSKAKKLKIRVKWTPVQNLHITVKFLGNNIPIDNLSEIMASLDQELMELSSFSTDIEKVGSFPNMDRSRVIWLGVSQQDVFSNIFQKVEKAMAQLNIPPERHSYSPHITIGRLRNPRNTNSILSPFLNKQFGNVLIDKIILYESLLSPHGSTYLPLHQINLKKDLNS